MKKKEDNIRDLWNNIKCANICILGVPEGEEVPESPRQDKTKEEQTFPCGTVVKNPPCNAGDTDLIPVREDPTGHRATKPACHSF